jgi:hypothetical protein
VERVGALLEGQASTTLRRRLGEARALARWPEIVGSQLADRTRPLQVAGRRLFVVCHGSPLRQELVFLKREIQRRFNEHAGPGRVREIVFLEADANLSPLLREAEREEARLVARESGPAGEGERSPPGPADEPEDAVEEEREPEPVTYPAFDGEAYRREMRRIAEGR